VGKAVGGRDGETVGCVDEGDPVGLLVVGSFDGLSGVYGDVVGKLVGCSVGCDWAGDADGVSVVGVPDGMLDGKEGDGFAVGVSDQAPPNDPFNSDFFRFIPIHSDFPIFLISPDFPDSF